VKTKRESIKKEWEAGLPNRIQQDMGDEQSLIARDKQSSQKNEEIRHPSMQTTSGGRAWECESTALLLAAVEELAAFGIFGAALASGMDQGGDTFLSDLRG